MIREKLMQAINRLDEVGFLDNVVLSEDPKTDDVFLSLFSGNKEAHLNVTPQEILISSGDSVNVIRGASEEADFLAFDSIVSRFAQDNAQPTFLPKKFLPKGFPSEFKNVSIYPDRIENSVVVFKDLKGKDYILNSSHAPNVTLSLYHILYDENGSSLMLQMPSLVDKSKTKIPYILKSSAEQDLLHLESLIGEIPWKTFSLNSNLSQAYDSYIDRSGSVLSIKGNVDRDSRGRAQALLSSVGGASGKAPSFEESDFFTLSLQGSRLILSGFYSRSPLTAGIKEFHGEVELARLSAALEPFALTLSDLDRPVTISSSNYSEQAFGGFRKFLNTHARILPARSVANSTRVKRASVESSALVYAGEDSCVEICQGRRSEKRNYEQALLSRDLPKELKSFDVVRFVRIV